MNLRKVAIAGGAMIFVALVAITTAAHAQKVAETLAPEITTVSEQCIRPAKAFWLDLDEVRVHPAGSRQSEDAWEMILGPKGSWEILQRNCAIEEIARVNDWVQISEKELRRIIVSTVKR